MMFNLKDTEKKELIERLERFTNKPMPSYVSMLPTTGEQDKSSFTGKDGIIKFEIGALRMTTEDNRMRKFPVYPTAVGIISHDHKGKEFDLKKGDIVLFNPTSTYERVYNREQYLITTSVSVLELVGNIYDKE